MPGSRERLLSRLLQAGSEDDRVVGLMDYGSGGHSRSDKWSDVDAALFIRDRAYDDFVDHWRAWSAGLGDLLFAYVGRFGHWAMYSDDDLPLRVDFDFIRESEMDQVIGWPMAPTTLDSMVLYDATGGKLTSLIRSLVGRTDRPDDLPRTLEALIGDFWYFSLFCCSKLGRGEVWVARLVFHSQVLDNLALLLRLEGGALDRWVGGHAAVGLEKALADSRSTDLDACIPGRAGRTY